MRAIWNRAAIEWCRVFHPEPTWPVHGHYHCPACLRTYPVPWQEGDDFLRRSGSGERDRRDGFVVFAFQKNHN